jgi:hypothetical protein
VSDQRIGQSGRPSRHNDRVLAKIGLPAAASLQANAESQNHSRESRGAPVAGRWEKDLVIHLTLPLRTAER